MNLELSAVRLCAWFQGGLKFIWNDWNLIQSTTNDSIQQSRRISKLFGGIVSTGKARGAAKSSDLLAVRGVHYSVAGLASV